MIRNWKFYR